MAIRLKLGDSVNIPLINFVTAAKMHKIIKVNIFFIYKLKIFIKLIKMYFCLNAKNILKKIK
jgi:hypothetical protein